MTKAASLSASGHHHNQMVITSPSVSVTVIHGEPNVSVNVFKNVR